MPSGVALIPARSGSERVPDKNIRPLAGHPLLAYAVATARQAGIFDRVNAEDRFVVEGLYEGAQAPLARPGRVSWLEREIHDFIGYLDTDKQPA